MGIRTFGEFLTDYGFIGHPFRKDFPLSGHVEVRYDDEKEAGGLRARYDRAQSDSAPSHSGRRIR